MRFSPSISSPRAWRRRWYPDLIRDLDCRVGLYFYMRIVTPAFCFLFSGISAPAQISLPLPIPSSFNQTQTFGMIGVALNQTARLNALNSSSAATIASLTAPPACKVTLQIFDDQNLKLAELDIADLAPGTAQHLDFARARYRPRPLRHRPCACRYGAW